LLDGECKLELLQENGTKQPAAKLEPVIVVYVYWQAYFYYLHQPSGRKKF